ncbi:MAG: cation transporter [Myxococcales bacterium]|nr:cation transporter [Myxococcales bacterium]
MSAGGGSLKVVIAALIGNGLIAIAKFVAYMFTLSSAMLAESIHSLADTGNQALLLFGMKRAKRPPDAAHPYGYGKESYFWSFVVAISIFTLGAVFACYEGVHKLQNALGGDAVVKSQKIAIIVLGVSIVIETFSFGVAIKEFNQEAKKMGLGLWAAVRETRKAEMVTVLFEDAAAMAGLLIALAGVSLTALTGNAVYDGAATLMIGVILAWVAWFLSVNTMRLLVGTSANQQTEEKLRAIVDATAEVENIIDLKTIHFGADTILLNLGLQFSPTMAVHELEQVIDSIEGQVKSQVPEVKRIFIEADSLRHIGPRPD